MWKALSRFSMIAAALVAVPAHAYVPANAAEEMLVAWLEESGCTLPQSEFMSRALSADIIAPSDLMAARRAMTNAGSLVRGDGGLTLKTGAVCGPANTASSAPAPNGDEEGDGRSRVLAMFEANNCVLTEDQLPDVAAQFNVTRKQFRPVAKAMEKAGELVENGDKITLRAGEMCSGDKKSANGAASYQPQTDNERILVAMFEENGCTLTEDRLPDLAWKYEISKSDFRAAAQAMEAAGMFVSAGDTITLLGGKCAENATSEGADPSDKRAIVVRVFEENGCMLSRDQSNKLFSAAGLSLEKDRDLVRGMISAGDISLEKKTGVATYLKGSVCGKDNGIERPTDTRAKIIALMERNSCSLTEEQARLQGPAVGIDLERDQAVFETMFESGELVEGMNDSARLVIGDRCKNVVDPARAAIISAFEANDCSLTEEVFEAAMADSGYDVDDAGDLVEAMMEAGQISYNDETKRARLSIGDACGK